MTDSGDRRLAPSTNPAPKTAATSTRETPATVPPASAPRAANPDAFGLEHDDPVVWGATLERLAALNTTSAAKTLEQLATGNALGAVGELIRTRAALLRLAMVATPSLSFLRACFAGDDDAVRESAAARLQTMLRRVTPDLIAVDDELVVALSQDPSARVRYESIGLLDHLRNADTRATCLEMLCVDPNPRVRDTARHAMTKTPPR